MRLRFFVSFLIVRQKNCRFPMSAQMLKCQRFFAFQQQLKKVSRKQQIFFTMWVLWRNNKKIYRFMVTSQLGYGLENLFSSLFLYSDKYLNTDILFHFYFIIIFHFYAFPPLVLFLLLMSSKKKIATKVFKEEGT